MPSLRRALSTPSVRVSPYPSLLTSRSQRSGHRRSSGSDISARKVLADIDWWRVADGQREKSGDEGEDGGEGEEEEGDEGEATVLDADPASAGLPHAPVAAQLAVADHSENASIGIGRPSTPDMGVRIFGLGYNSPQSHLATTPRTPIRRTVSESSASSLESTPEVLLTPPLERLSFADLGFADPGPGIPFFQMRLASFGALPFVPKSIAPEFGGLDKDPILPDSLISHDDLFA